jgi:hypothetical protein
LASPLSLSIANPGLFLYPAIKLRRPIDWLAEVGYVVALVLMFTQSNPDGSFNETATAALFASWVLGTAHALVIRRRAFSLDQPDHQELVLAHALEARERRADARKILDSDPKLASDLGIGRPDLQRGYDDGGLIDVNTAPLDVISALSGVTPEIAQRLQVAREAAGGFSSIEEMAILADLPPTFVDAVRDKVVLSPR